MNIQERLAQVVPVRLEPNLDGLSDGERRMLPLLVEAARAMDDAFWVQSYGDREALLAQAGDAATRRYLRMCYGPWDRLREDEAFVAGAGPRPTGANFYPADMTEEEFAAAAAERPDLHSRYTMVRRDAQGRLVAIPYHRFFDEPCRRAASKLRQAAALAENPELQTFLSLRAEALLTDEYRSSDFAWMDMKANALDILIGPMETSADRLLWAKAAFASTLFAKDWAWSRRLARYVELLPRFQAHLPAPAAYKAEPPGLDSDLYVYDAIYCAGYDNSSIALGINWPDDEEVRARKGTRSLQVKNLMRAKFDTLLAPLVPLLVAADQAAHVTFDAFFLFIVFHELGHALGLKHTLDGRGLVRDALGGEDYVVEEAKADVLSLAMITQLHQWGELSAGVLLDVYVTAQADIFRRGGRQAMARLNFFKEMGDCSRAAGTGTYRLLPEYMGPAISAPAERLLRLQGDGDYAGARAFLERYAQPDTDVARDLARVNSAGLPLEIMLEQD